MHAWGERGGARGKSVSERRWTPRCRFARDGDYGGHGSWVSPSSYGGEIEGASATMEVYGRRRNGRPCILEGRFACGDGHRPRIRRRPQATDRTLDHAKTYRRTSECRAVLTRQPGTLAERLVPGDGHRPRNAAVHRPYGNINGRGAIRIHRTRAKESGVSPETTSLQAAL